MKTLSSFFLVFLILFTCAKGDDAASTSMGLHPDPSGVSVLSQTDAQEIVEAYVQKHVFPPSTLTCLEWSNFSSSGETSSISLLYKSQQPGKPDVVATVRFTLRGRSVSKTEILHVLGTPTPTPMLTPTPTPTPEPKVVDHFTRPLASAKFAAPMAMHMSNAFRLADLEKAKAKAVKEKKPLGFIMIWETKGEFFNYSTDTRNKYGSSALLHFYKGFNDNLVLVFVRHEDELGLVPPAVQQGFSGPDEGGWAPNMAVTDATAQEFIVEIPTRNQEGSGRDAIFSEGAKKIDSWLSTHSDAMTKSQ